MPAGDTAIESLEPAFARSEGFGAPAQDLGVKPAGLPRAEILTSRGDADSPVNKNRAGFPARFSFRSA